MKDKLVIATEVVMVNFFQKKYTHVSSPELSFLQTFDMSFANKPSIFYIIGFPGGASGKELTCQGRRLKGRKFNSWVGKIPWRRV